jgi:hypothetical protein
MAFLRLSNRFPTVFQRLPFGFPMVFLWLSCDHSCGYLIVFLWFPIVFLWHSLGLRMFSVWLPHGFLMVVLWFAYGFPLVFLCFPMVFLWLSCVFSCGVPEACLWRSYDVPMAFPWCSYGYPKAIL